LAFPELGQIRKGSPKQKIIKDGREIEIQGKDLEFFRFDLDEREVEAIATVKKIYGDRPTDLNIVLPFNEIDQCWEAFLEAYTAGRMVARTDGEVFIYLVETKTGNILVKNGIDVETGKPRPYSEGMIVGYDYKNQPIKCKATGRLKVVLPELQRLAFLTVLTSSLYDISNLSSQLLAIQTFCNNMGKGIGGIPLVLRRRPHEISCPDLKDKGKRVRRTKWLLSVEMDPEAVKRSLMELKRLALPGNGLTMPSPENPITGPDWSDIPEDEGDEDETPEPTGEIVEGKTTSAPESASKESAPAPRPWSPCYVKARVMALVGEYGIKSCTASEDDRHLVAATLDTTFKGDKTMRYLLCRWLLDLGDGSTKDMAPTQIKALMAWQGVKKFGDIPTADTVTETLSVYTAALEASGQSKLL